MAMIDQLFDSSQKRLARQLGRFDAKTETFNEFPLPDPNPTSYGIEVDRNDFVWYSSYDDDILGRLNPNTGVVVEYPFS
jgi:streptogramin lyase